MSAEGEGGVKELGLSGQDQAEVTLPLPAAEAGNGAKVLPFVPEAGPSEMDIQAARAIASALAARAGRSDGTGTVLAPLRTQAREDAPLPFRHAEERGERKDTDISPRITPEPPAWIGPLATPEMGECVSKKPAENEAERTPALPPLAALPEEKKPAPMLLPLELCAAIAASIARRPHSSDEILLEHDLDMGTFRRLLRYHLDHIRNDARQGESAKLRAFDAAYVAQLEGERGAITPTEYVCLTRAAQYDGVAPALSSFGLPRDAWIRIQRVWVLRLAREPLLRERVRESLSRG
jgi:hypothetical protein